MHQRKSKAWDMRFYWLKDRDAKNQIHIYWKKGKNDNDPNRADYHTKHFPTIYHRGIRPTYVFDK